MQTSLIQDWTYALLTELNRHKGKAALVFLLTVCALVIAGLVWPKHYEASAIVFADDQNIIKPLLAGQAEVTRPEQVDQLTVVRQRISSNQILEQVLLDAKMVDDVSDKYKIQPLIRSLQGGIVVNDAGRNHYKIAYRSKDAATAYLLASTLTDVFIRDSARTKRQESGEAFTFIDAQVKTYKEQLQGAEEKLKNFKSQNPEGSEDTISKRISDLRGNIEALSLDLQVARTRRDELRQQLTHESAFIAQSYRASVYRDSLTQAQAKLDTLRLSYQETYPDIVALKQQIQDLQHSITQAENQPASGGSASNSASNPVYQKLKTDLSDAEVSVRTLELRVASNQRLLEDSLSHSRQGAEYQAQLAELTRDYNVTRQIYESMLERKEKARLSMALDVQGQGLNYKIQEPPVYPTVPVGIRFMHFFLIAPLAGLLAPIGLVVALIFLDPQIRFVERMQTALPKSVTVLAIIPHMTTSQERREIKSEWRNVVIFMAAVLVVYALLGVARLLGWLG
ncbi:MAG TPA: XrtA system polysaccharide chain length determinant [Spongiibacteraceae bacterium]|nr:XrtA system polysaccharide chain length determinant [Spongiibacteraceae bacterium]